MWVREKGKWLKRGYKVKVHCKRKAKRQGYYKTLSKLLTLTLIFVIAFSNLLNISVVGTEDCRAWKQKDIRWANTVLGSNGQTMGDVGCLVTSVAILMQMSGTVEDGFNPNVLCNTLRDNGAFNGSSALQYGSFKYNGDFQWSYRSGDFSQARCISDIKKAIDDGCYITAQVEDRHWVAVMGYDSKGIKMADPGTSNPAEYILDGYTSITGYNIWVCSVDFENATYFDGSVGTSNIILARQRNERTRGLLREDDFITDGDFVEQFSTFVERDSLELDEKLTLSNWVTDLEFENSQGVNKIIRSVLSLLGIVLTVWGVFLFLSYLVDVTVPIFDDVSILRLCSFGLYRPIDEEALASDERIRKHSRPKPVGMRGILTVSVCTVLLGVLIVSGTFYRFTQFIINFVVQIIEN